MMQKYDLTKLTLLASLLQEIPLMRLLLSNEMYLVAIKHQRKLRSMYVIKLLMQSEVAHLRDVN